MLLRRVPNWLFFFLADLIGGPGMAEPRDRSNWLLELGDWDFTRLEQRHCRASSSGWDLADLRTVGRGALNN